MEKKKLLLNSKGKALLTEDGKILIAPPNSQEILTKYININANGTYDVREYGYANVNVPVPEGYLKPQGTLTIKDEGTYDVRQYASVNLDIETEQIIVDPSDKEQTFVPSASKYFDKVVVNAIPEGLIIPYGTVDITTTEEVDVGAYKTAQVVDSNLIADNIKKDIAILGITGTYEGEGDSTNTLKKLLNTTKSGNYLFYNYQGISVDDLISYSDTENVVSMNSMFYDCRHLQTIPLLNTSNVKTMHQIFRGCANLQTIPQLNTSNVTLMSNMFYDCDSLQTIPQLDTSNATYMDSMFYSCDKLQTIPQLNTSNVTNMSYMFQFCNRLQTIPLLDTSNVANMKQMFRECNNLQAIDITSMDKITSTSYIGAFAYRCYSLTKFIIRTMTVKPTLNSDSFTDCYHFTGTYHKTYNPEGLKDGRIYIPDDKVEELKQATNWSVYADIIVPLSTLVEE